MVDSHTSEDWLLRRYEESQTKIRVERLREVSACKCRGGSAGCANRLAGVGPKPQIPQLRPECASPAQRRACCCLGPGGGRGGTGAPGARCTETRAGFPVGALRDYEPLLLLEQPWRGADRAVPPEPPRTRAPRGEVSLRRVSRGGAASPRGASVSRLPWRTDWEVCWRKLGFGEGEASDPLPLPQPSWRLGGWSIN